VRAVVVTGPPGAGKTVVLVALSDTLVVDGIAHAAVDVDEIAWAFPYPDVAGRCELLRAWRASHPGHALLLVAEVIESPDHLACVRAALGVEELLLVRLDAGLDVLRSRVIAREPPGWHGLQYLLDETPGYRAALEGLDGVDLVLDSERLTQAEIVERIRELMASAG
jgi:hypothetical protein